MLNGLRHAARPVLVALFCASVAACSTAGQDDEDEFDERVLVGDVDGSDAVLAAIRDGTSVTVYVCGGDSTFDTHTRWFGGGSIDGEGAFSIDLEDWTIAGTFDDLDVAGTLTDPDGAQMTYSASAISTDSIAGLYTAEPDGCRTGVVLQDNGGGITGQGTWCNQAAEFGQVIILEPIEVTAQGIAVEVPLPTETKSFFVSKF